MTYLHEAYVPPALMQSAIRSPLRSAALTNIAITHTTATTTTTADNRNLKMRFGFMPHPSAGSPRPLRGTT